MAGGVRDEDLAGAARTADGDVVVRVAETAVYTVGPVALRDAGLDQESVVLGFHAQDEFAHALPDAAGSADNSSETYKGLALALADAGTGKWCSQWSTTCLTTQYSSGEQTNDMSGIANTDYLITNDPDGHDHAAASVARNYAVDHPTGTSAWFLPSAGQRDKMVNACKNVLGSNGNYTDLRDGFSARGGTNLMKDYYQTSTENIARWPFRFDFSNGNNGNLDYKFLTGRVRSAFAF